MILVYFHVLFSLFFRFFFFVNAFERSKQRVLTRRWTPKGGSGGYSVRQLELVSPSSIVLWTRIDGKRILGVGWKQAVPVSFFLRKFCARANVVELELWHDLREKPLNGKTRGANSMASNPRLYTIRLSSTWQVTVRKVSNSRSSHPYKSINNENSVTRSKTGTCYTLQLIKARLYRLHPCSVTRSTYIRRKWRWYVWRIPTMRLDSLTCYQLAATTQLSRVR